MANYIATAKVLSEALPYFRQFYGKTVVIKYGGSAMEDESIRQSTANDVVLMKYVGMNPVIVHGGGKAIGISGKDGSLIEAVKYRPDGEPDVDIGYVGKVSRINPDPIRTLEQGGYIAVVAPIGFGEDGKTYNVNADSVAGEMAAALRAEKLVLLTDTPGILREKGDESSLISSLKLSEIQELIESGVIDGGMLPKVEACERALEAGVDKTHIIDGRILHALLLEIFTDKGIGTQFIR